MKKLLLLQILAIIFISVALTAAETPFSINKDNYFISGKEDVKIRVSAKYNLLYPFNLGIYMGYTEVAFWDIYKKSSPFREFNHNPEVFWLIKEGNNIFNNTDLSFIDFIKISPYEHMSNGKDGDASRSIDRTYAELQVSAGGKVNFGLRTKAWCFYGKSRKNRDIDEYIGHGEAELFAAVIGDMGKDFPLYKLYVKGGVGDSFDKGWVNAGFIFPIITAYIQPRIMIDIFHGYAESMIDYNKKDTQVRAGTVFMF